MLYPKPPPKLHLHPRCHTATAKVGCPASRTCGRIPANSAAAEASGYRRKPGSSRQAAADGALFALRRRSSPARRLGAQQRAPGHHVRRKRRGLAQESGQRRLRATGWARDARGGASPIRCRLAGLAKRTGLQEIP